MCFRSELDRWRLILYRDTGRREGLGPEGWRTKEKEGKELKGQTVTTGLVRGHSFKGGWSGIGTNKVLSRFHDDESAAGRLVRSGGRDVTLDSIDLTFMFLSGRKKWRYDIMTVGAGSDYFWRVSQLLISKII